MQAAADSYVQVILAGETPYQIVWASEAWLKLCGYTTEQACGQTLALIEGPLTSAASAEQLMRAIRAGNPTKVPIVHHARGGRAFSHTLRIEPLKDSLGMVQCFQVTSADVQMLKDGDGPSPAEQQQYTSPEHGEGGDQQASKAAAADGEPRLELDEMLEWLDSGSGPRPSGMSRTSSMTKMADAEGQ